MKIKELYNQIPSNIRKVTTRIYPIRQFHPSLPPHTMVSNFGDAEQRAHDPKPHEQRADAEKHVGRNPHPDFSKVQASRPDWEEQSQWHFTKTRKPDWKLGEGANDGGESLKKKHVEIDPYEEGRPAIFNYKLLISGIVPRPVGFISTRSEDGTPYLSTLLKFRFASELKN